LILAETFPVDETINHVIQTLVIVEGNTLELSAWAAIRSKIAAKYSVTKVIEYYSRYKMALK